MDFIDYCCSMFVNCHYVIAILVPVFVCTILLSAKTIVFVVENVVKLLFYSICVGRATEICVVAAHICFSSRWQLGLVV